jgi:hypothetical protein
MGQKRAFRKKRKNTSSGMKPVLFTVLGLLLLGGAITGVVLLASRKGKSTAEKTEDEQDNGQEETGPLPKPDRPMVTTLPGPWGGDPGLMLGELAQAVQAAGQEDPRWRMADIDTRPLIPDEENGAILAQAAAKRLNGARVETLPQLKGLAPQQPVPGLDAVRSQLKKLAPALRLARRAADYPRGRFALQIQADGLQTPLPHVSEAREIGLLLYADAVVRAADGQGGPALDSCRAAHNVSRYLAGEPIMLTQLARIGMDLLLVEALERIVAMKDGPPAEALLAFQRQLEEDSRVVVFRDMMRYDRAVGHYTLTNLQDGHCRTLSGKAVPTPTQQDHAGYLANMNQVVAAAEGSYQDQAKRYRELVAKLKMPGPRSRDMLPDGQKLLQACHRGTARMRAAVLGLAAERFRRDTGQWPTSLDELGPKYLAAVPADNFTNGPFSYASQPEGRSICTGGVSARASTGRFAELNTQPDGPLGFRLVDVDKRK